MSNLDERLERGGAAVRRMAATVPLAPPGLTVDAGRIGGRRPPIGLIVVASLTLVVALAATFLFLGPNRGSDMVGPDATSTSMPQAEPDIRITLPEDTTDEVLERAVAEVMALDGVSFAQGLNRDAAFAEFSELFAGCPGLVEVASQDLSVFPIAIKVWVGAEADIVDVANSILTTMPQSGVGPVDIALTRDAPPTQNDCVSSTTTMAVPSQLEQAGVDLQAEIIADGFVSQEEFVRAVSGMAACMTDHGFNGVTWSVDEVGGGWSMDYQSLSPADDPAEQAIYSLCYYSYIPDSGLRGEPPIPEISTLQPVRVTCTAELEGHPCSALIDGDPNTTWQAPDGGIGVTITFLFAEPIQIRDLALANEPGDAYMRNGRVRGLVVTPDDLSQPITLELDDTNELQVIDIQSLRTSTLEVQITSAYPGQSVGDEAPFTDIALGEITLRGRLGPDDRVDVGFPYLLIDAGRLDQSLSLDSAFDQEISVDSPERLRAFGLPDASPTAARIWFVTIPGGSDFFRGDGFEDPQWEPLPVEQGRAFIRTGPVGSSVMWETGDPGGEVVVAHALMVEPAVLIDVVSGLEKDDSGWGPRFLPEGFIELYDGPARADVERLIAQSWTDVEEGDGSAIELYLIDRGPDGGEQALNELLGFTVSELEIGATEVRGKPALVYAIGNETIFQWMETATVTVRVVIRGPIDSASVLSALVLVDQATWDAAMSDANRDRGVGPPPTVAPANTDP